MWVACWQRALARGHEQRLYSPIGFICYSLCWLSVMEWQVCTYSYSAQLPSLLPWNCWAALSSDTKG